MFNLSLSKSNDGPQYIGSIVIDQFRERFKSSSSIDIEAYFDIWKTAAVQIISGELGIFPTSIKGGVNDDANTWVGLRKGDDVTFLNVMSNPGSIKIRRSVVYHSNIAELVSLFNFTDVSTFCTDVKSVEIFSRKEI